MSDCFPIIYLCWKIINCDFIYDLVERLRLTIFINDTNQMPDVFQKIVSYLSAAMEKR